MNAPIAPETGASIEIGRARRLIASVRARPGCACEQCVVSALSVALGIALADAMWPRDADIAAAVAWQMVKAAQNARAGELRAGEAFSCAGRA